MATATATPRAINGAMLAATTPIVPYGFSKTTHDAIKPQTAKRMTKASAPRNAFSTPQYLQFVREAGPFLGNDWLEHYIPVLIFHVSRSPAIPAQTP